MAISAEARSRILRPNSSATPYSVTTVRMWARLVTTPAPSAKTGTMREIVPLPAVGRALRGWVEPDAF